MNTKTPDAYEYIGQAVAAVQQFELVFILVAKFAIKQNDVSVLEDIVPISQKKSFKQPLADVLSEIKKENAIGPDLDGRIQSLVEHRNTIVHRLTLDFGWPERVERTPEIIELCKRVTADSIDLVNTFMPVLLVWMNKFPALQQTVIDQMNKVGLTKEALVAAVSKITSAKPE